MLDNAKSGAAIEKRKPRGNTAIVQVIYRVMNEIDRNADNRNDGEYLK